MICLQPEPPVVDIVSASRSPYDLSLSDSVPATRIKDNLSSGDHHMINRLYGLLQKLPLQIRSRVFSRLRKLGVEQRLEAQGHVVYAYDGCTIGVDLSDHVGREMFKHGWYESLYIDFIRRYMADPAGLFLDVGANVGNYSLALASYFSQTLAFEPNPGIYPALVANCGRNPSLAICPVPVGLSSEYATLRFHLSAEHNSGESSFEPGAGSNSDACLSLDVAPGDAYVADGQRVALIKIDVEGHELNVLTGLTATLSRDRPTVCLEWHTELMKTHGGVEKLKALLPDDYVVVYSASRYHIDLQPLAAPYRKKYNLIFCVPRPRLASLGFDTEHIRPLSERPDSQSQRCCRQRLTP